MAKYIVSYSNQYPKSIDNFFVVETVFLPEITVLRNLANNSSGQNLYRICIIIAVFINHCLHDSKNFAGIFWGSDEYALSYISKKLISLGFSLPIYYMDKKQRIRKYK